MDIIFVGFNKQVIALDRYTGEKKWVWKSPKGSGYPTILVDGDRLIVSVHGYTYCLEPTTGALVWENELKGLGTGISCLASSRGNYTHSNSFSFIVLVVVGHACVWRL